MSSIDLNACKDVETLEELFNFGNDYLGLIKAGVIASGLVPPSIEGTGVTLREVLDRVVRDGHGLEVVSKVNDIPKGSRLAVSTNLLASLISLLMRATGQARNSDWGIDPEESAGGRCAGDLGRMARRFRRRLARFRRRVSGSENHIRSRRRRIRSRVGRQSRPAFAQT